MSLLIVCPYSGFSNRLKSLVSASLIDKDYKVYWPLESFCGLGYADIFCDKFREIDHIPADSTLLSTWRFELPMELKQLLPTGFSDCSTGYKGINFPGDDQSSTIDFEYLKIPLPILAVLRKQFSQICFSEEIMDRVNARLCEMPDQYVGVHARTWLDEPERRQKWFDFDSFVSICSRFKDKEIFVTSDDPEFIKSLSSALNKKLLTLESTGQRAPKPWQQNSREEMLDDIVELLVLSKASHLVLTAMSTYSEVAWFFGGCIEDVYFADPGFMHKGHADQRSSEGQAYATEINESNFRWIEVTGSPSYHLALITGQHVHLEALAGGSHRIGDYVEKYRGYMKGSAPKDFMIDVGANLGLSAFPVASMQRRVIAFEPVSDNIEAMKKSIDRNRFDNVTLVESAVSSRVGETVLYVPRGRADNASFGRDVANANVFSPEVFTLTVRSETIDHWFEGHDKEFRPADARLLKIDVQGYETEVLSGANDFIAACQPFEKLIIEFEFDPKLTKMAGYSTVELLELIHSYGLEICYNGNRIDPGYYAEFCSQEINCDLIALFPVTGDLKKATHFYGQDFYDSQILGSLQSAQVYLYHLFSIWGIPNSVIDIGCGRGAWLATCKDFGVTHVVGVDGDWNSQHDMLDQSIEFHSANLEQAICLSDSFDLAISLEVAEHLQPESSDRFVESLIRLSDVILFGAAFIGQPGNNHINTRLHSFWAQKFFDRGYLLFDLFRPTFWDDDRIEPCYRQNTFMFVKPGHPLEKALTSSGYRSNPDAKFLDCVHPVIYKGLLNEFIKLQQAAAGTGLQERPTLQTCGSEVSSDASESIEQLIELAVDKVRLNQFCYAAEIYYQVLTLEPNNSECLLRLSHILLLMKKYEDCFHYARHFLRIISDVSFGYYLAGHSARELGRWQEARSYLVRAVELDPTHVFARVLCCMSIFTVCMDDMETNSMVRSYSDELDSLIRSTALDTDVQIDTAAFGIGALAPFFLPYLGCDVKSLQAHYGSWVCSVMAARYPQFVQPLSPSLSTDRIKIGIVSHYFYNHSNLKAPIRGWLEQLDRQLFSVHCFHTGEFIDMATETARSISDTFLQSSDIELVATAIREQCIDVLIYPGIGMDTVTLKLAALRLVPVQCSSWGHPVTTGMPTIDYFISSDLMEPPDGDEHYTEKLIRLPHLSIWYEPTEPQQNSFPEFVIPGCEKHDFIYLCSQNLLKYLPRYDFVFPAIAREVENARFVFIASHIGELNDKFLRRLDLAFSTMGLNVNDHVSIILQLDEVGFSTLNSKADIFLDTIEWSGCNTVFESLPFNKPIVTLPGKFMRSRHTYAILKMMNIEDTIASNVDDYISISVRLANDIEYRRDVSARLCRNKHKIYRDRKCIDALERFLVDATGYGKPRELYE